MNYVNFLGQQKSSPSCGELSQVVGLPRTMPQLSYKLVTLTHVPRAVSQAQGKQSVQIRERTSKSFQSAARYNLL